MFKRIFEIIIKIMKMKVVNLYIVKDAIINKTIIKIKTFV